MAHIKNLSLALVLIGVSTLGVSNAQREKKCDVVEITGQELVPNRLIQVMDNLAKEYCVKHGKSTIIVTSGVRTPNTQARLMQSCLSRNACGYYANNEAATELQRTYNAAKVGAKLIAVEQKISEQINRNEPCFISKHLTKYALDLERYDNGSIGNCQADLKGDDLTLSNVLKSSADVYNVTYKEAGGCTHFHVNFVGWENIEGLSYCPNKDN